MPLPKVDLKRVGEWIDTGRSLAALLFIPFLCLYACGLVYILWLGGWGENTAVERVKWLGISLLGLIILIGLGVLWLQRRDIPSFSVTTPWGTANVSEGHEANVTVSPTAAAAINAVTPPGTPPVIPGKPEEGDIQ